MRHRQRTIGEPANSCGKTEQEKPYETPRNPRGTMQHREEPHTADPVAPKQAVASTFAAKRPREHASLAAVCTAPPATRLLARVAC